MRTNQREAKNTREKEPRSITGKKLQTTQAAQVANNYVQIAYHPSTVKGSQSNAQHFSFEPNEISGKTATAHTQAVAAQAGKRSMSVKNANQAAAARQDHGSDGHLSQKQSQKTRGSSAINQTATSAHQQVNMKNKQMVYATGSQMLNSSQI